MGGEGWIQSIRMSRNRSNSDHESNVPEVLKENLKPVNEALQGRRRALCKITDSFQQMNANQQGNMNHKGNDRPQVPQSQKPSESLINEPWNSRSKDKKRSEEGIFLEPGRSSDRYSYEKEGELGELQILDDFVCTSSVTNSKFLELEVKDYYESNNAQNDQGANYEMSSNVDAGSWANGPPPIWPLYCDSFYAKAPYMNGIGGGVLIPEAVQIDAMMPWGQASWGPAWGMPLSPVALVLTNVDSCPSMLVKHVQNSVALQSDSKGEGSLQFPKNLRIDSTKGLSCDGQSILVVGIMAIALSGVNYDSPCVLIVGFSRMIDDQGCVNFGGLLRVTGHYGSRACFVVSLDTRVLLTTVQFSSKRNQGDVDTKINGHWNLDSKTRIRTTMITSWTLVSYSPRLSPTKGLNSQARKKRGRGILLAVANVGITEILISLSGSVKSNISNLEALSEEFSLAIHIALLRSLRRDDSKKICVDNDPKWISFPISEQVKQLNRQSSKMWPFMVDAITRIPRQSVELLLEEYRPPRISSSKFSKLFLGNVAPKIEAIQIQGFEKTQIVMDLAYQWGGDISIIFVVQTLGALLPSQLKDL
eukprot:Gb_35266 [translate_table: standard]